jgi:hypothetical protein
VVSAPLWGCGSGRERMIDTDVAPRGASQAWAEGEGKVDGPTFVNRIAALADNRGSHLNSDGLPRSCIYPKQGSRDSRTAFVAHPDATAAEVARFFKPQD